MGTGATVSGSHAENLCSFVQEAFIKLLRNAYQFVVKESKKQMHAPYHLRVNNLVVVRTHKGTRS